jgi:LmbE family N-acetylglucosaminyl deacetylase
MVKRLIVVPAHPDDGELTHWPYINYLAAGYDVIIAAATRGDVTAASLRLDPDDSHYNPVGQPVCQTHPWKHDPGLEQYTVPTKDEIGLARLHEGMSAAGAMAMIPPSPGSVSGTLTYLDFNLGGQYGCNFCGSSTAPWTEEAVALADGVFRQLIADYPGSIFWTHSPTDHHPDHAALGVAFRRIKGTPHLLPTDPMYVAPDPVLGAALINSMFMVSKLYWGPTPPRPPEVLAEQCAWYPNIYPDNTKVLARRAEYTAWIKDHVVPCYSAWNPAGGSFAIGAEHSTPSQFASCFGQPPPFVASALQHK